jgi:hypothetical protein
MLPALIVAIFFIGFLFGYATRVWRSRRRRAHYLMHGPKRSISQADDISGIDSKQPVGAFAGRARRAF